jgi:hypothetical protein
MHANHRRRLDRFAALDFDQVDHANAGMRLALAASLDARVAADASARVYVKIHLHGQFLRQNRLSTMKWRDS